MNKINNMNKINKINKMNNLNKKNKTIHQPQSITTRYIKISITLMKTPAIL